MQGDAEEDKKFFRLMSKHNLHDTLLTLMKDRAEEKTEMELHIEQLFEQMLPKEDAPEAIKKEVFQTLDTLNLMGDVLDLFTTKFTQTESEFLDILTDEEIPPSDAPDQ